MRTQTRSNHRFLFLLVLLAVVINTGCVLSRGQRYRHFTAANLFELNGIIIHGEPEIRAEDPAATTIIGNFRFDYSHKQVDISSEPWNKKVFRIAHLKMEHDPEVWTRVEQLILDAVRNSRGHGARS